MKTATGPDGAHIEAEKGYRVSKTESRKLRSKLPELGFQPTKRSSLTDFVIPTKNGITRRMRIERIISGDSPDIRCIKGFKNHPIKGEAGKHVRMENEKVVKKGAALAFILELMQKLEAPIPYYTKKRRHYQGVFEGYDLTITLDRADRIGKYSGRYIEIETIMPLDSPEEAVMQALETIDRLAELLLGEERPAKISYRKMLMKTWRKKHAKDAKKKSGKRKKKSLPKVRRKKLRSARVDYRKLLKKVSKVKK